MRKKYATPQTSLTRVELEQGFMSSASIFDDANQQDDGVSVEGHEVGAEIDLSGSSWDNSGFNTGF